MRVRYTNKYSEEILLKLLFLLLEINNIEDSICFGIFIHLFVYIIESYDNYYVKLKKYNISVYCVGNLYFINKVK
jgi:hypothetical protein